MYHGVRRKEAKFKAGGKEVIHYKFSQLSYLQRIASVVASEGGGFAAIREDQLPVLSIPIQPELSLHSQMKAALTGPPIHLRGEVDEEFDAGFFDVCFYLADDRDQAILAHSAVLAANSEFFYALFSHDAEEITHSTHFIGNGGGTGGGKKNNLKTSATISTQRILARRGIIYHVKISNVVVLNSVSTSSVSDCLLFVLSFLYTGHVDVEMLKPGSSPFNPSSPLCQQTIRNLLKLFGLPDVLGFVYTKTVSYEKSVLKVQSAFHQIYVDTDYFQRMANVKIDLADNLSVYAHQVIICQRCPFFNAMIGDSGRWSLRREDDCDDGKVVISLPQFSVRVFRIVLEWLYCDSGVVEVFSKVKQDSVQKYCDLVVDVLACADELLLDKLKDICAQALIMLLDLNSIISLIEVSYLFAVDSLRIGCLDFGKKNDFGM